ncbi:MAG: dihydroorotase [Bacteroidales bacterium]|nr:dihydroorotase [Bacteroidales bacterium]
MATLLRDGIIVNEGEQFQGSILIEGEKIAEIFRGDLPQDFSFSNVEIVSCEGKIIIPGVIDDQVHFREPGLTHKATIATESRAALAGGVTTFMDMPNVAPQTTTIEYLEQKLSIASDSSFANYAFYFGATNTNIDQLRALDKNIVCGVKVFMGSSTGNMLVDDEDTLRKIFSETKIPVAVHCEDEITIKENIAKFSAMYGDNIPFSCHPKIRSNEACFKSTQKAVELAKQCETHLHVLHLSTAEEMNLFSQEDVKNKRITAEVCVHHLWFTDNDYAEKGAFIKCNPAIKSQKDRDALRQALMEGRIDVVATDHAPHTIDEKNRPYTKSASGMPLVQHSLLVMLELYKQGVISLPLVVQKMCHNPAILFSIKDRGFIRKNYFADLVVIDLQKDTLVNKDNILYKCGWSPLEGTCLSAKVEKTFLNGTCVYSEGNFSDIRKAHQITFSH